MGRSSWERKMNTFVTPPPRGRRKVSTDQRLRAFDFVLDGTSVAEAARSVGIAPGSVQLPGWTRSEVGDYNRLYRDRVNLGVDHG